MVLKAILRKVGREFGVEFKRYSAPPHEEVISLKAKNTYAGNALVSYITKPFLLIEGESIPNSHTHYWESYQMVETFRELGYEVDVISYLNGSFIPEKDYSVFVSARTNLQRIALRLHRNCLRIAHLDTAHWMYNNYAAYKRSLELQQRRGIALKSVKLVEPNWAIEHADCATVLGNRFTIASYEYAMKPIYRIPISTCSVYPKPVDKNFERCKHHYLWFGSTGFVGKGLDLVLEAFAEMPDYHLFVCGPLEEERQFVAAYNKELYRSPNIHAIGWIDTTSQKFMEIARDCVGLIFPSCSEGGGGCVIQCMHAGLIPIVTYESSVDVGEFGMILHDCSVEGIRSTIRNCSSLSANELKERAFASWEFARTNHTRERFAEEYRKFAEIIKDKILSGKGVLV